MLTHHRFQSIPSLKAKLLVSLYGDILVIAFGKALKFGVDNARLLQLQKSL